MPFPRLCCLRLSDDFSGLGFSLIAKKNETGQYIDDVKEDSPAYIAGLKNGDILIEVNGENILSFSHREVVELIRKNKSEVSLLVLDSEARSYYENKNTIVHGQMAEVQKTCSWNIEVSDQLPKERAGFSDTLDKTSSSVSPRNSIRCFEITNQF